MRKKGGKISNFEFPVSRPDECPHIPELNYSEFGERLHKKVISKRIPISGSVELTFRCNLSCRHCYCNLPVTDRKAEGAELGTEEWKDLLDQIADAGCIWLLLTGGEPLVRPDFLEIYEYAKRKGMIITLFTNGTLITPELADFLADFRPFAVEVTLYGVTETVYERVTRVPGSFRRSIRGIDELTERGIPVRLKTMVMTLNQEELWQIKGYAESRGYEFRFDPLLNARLGGEKAPAGYRIPPEEVVKLDMADPKRLKSFKEFCEKFSGPPAHPERLYNCGAGRSSFHIDPYGGLSVCMLSRFDQYDLRQGSFREGWYQALPKFLERRVVSDSPCQRCELINLCGQCPGWAWLEHRDPEQRVEYLCRIAHLRAEMLGLGGKD